MAWLHFQNQLPFEFCPSIMACAEAHRSKRRATGAREFTVPGPSDLSRSVRFRGKGLQQIISIFLQNASYLNISLHDGTQFF